MTQSDAHLPTAMPPTIIPVLRSVWPDSEVPEALRAALDARAQEKAVFTAMADELLEQLRPEIARMTTEMVRSSIHQVWRKRSQLDL